MYHTKWLTERHVNPSLWLPRNQHDSTLACKMQGSPTLHEFKTEEVRKILLQLSCQAKPSSPCGYSCSWIVMFSVPPALRVGKVQPYKRGSWCLPADTGSSTCPGSSNCFALCRPGGNTDRDNRRCMPGRVAAVHTSLLPAFEMALLLV